MSEAEVAGMAAGSPPVAPDPYDGIPAFFRPRGAMRHYILRMGLVTLVPSISLSILLGFLGLPIDDVGESISDMPPVLMVLGTVVFSPVVETVILAVLLWLLSWPIKRPVYVACAACVLWGIAHSALHPAWGLVVWWPFFVFSMAYMAWRRISWWKPFCVACGIHMVQNSIPALAMAFE